MQFVVVFFWTYSVFISIFKLTDVSKDLDRLNRPIPENADLSEENQDFSDASQLSNGQTDYFNYRKDVDSLINKPCHPIVTSKQHKYSSNKPHHEEGARKSNSGKFTKMHSSTNDPSINNPPSLMKWHEIFTFDIITAILSFSLIRYMSVAFVSSTVILTTTKYQWRSDYLFALFCICNTLIVLVTTTLTKIGFFKGRSRPFFMYTMALITAALILTSLMLTKIDILQTFEQQVTFFALMKLAKAVSLFLGNTFGMLLLFHLVKPDDSSFVAGNKSLIMVIFKAVGFFTAYKASYFPEYFQPPVVLGMLILVQILLYRRRIYMTSTTLT